ncbi:putative bifunctional diguanylate cyclase/phosphodiesterase [Erythrobacter alti]|uniref:putative bifunctional diguanylate cyclase/phosphodiesterase n=1 Tax=Erythrobacter alti TaxID=1896145 RepID=UPI0030F45E0E
MNRGAIHQALTGPSRSGKTRALIAGAFLVVAMVTAVMELNFVIGALAFMGILAGVLAFIQLAREYENAYAQNQETIVSLEESQRKMRIDPLTGHLNRTAFTTILHDLAAIDSKSSMIMVLFFDLNRFKEVNDTLGHDVGDRLLQSVGERTSEVLNDPVAIARLGGDEFAAILPFESEEKTREVGEALINAIGRPYRLADRLVEVSASLGIAIGDPVVHGGDELLRRADMAMYEMKNAGRGAYHIFDDLMSNRQIRENSIRVELGKSQFDSRFMLHYQPIVDARTGRTEKVEALLRSQGTVLDGISPALMVSVAEDSGQIVQLTEWTLDTALQAVAQIRRPVTVNVSPVYFRHEDFAERLIDRLIASGQSPSSLVVEVTEGVLISDIVGARESIDLLRTVGIEVYLDDFGTGYSSLSYLQNFELDGMKLDKSFIQRLGQSDKAIRIIRSMVDFSHSLGMKTVIEGVESEWQARLLQLQGCDYLQGYELGVPMALETMVGRLNSEREQADASQAKTKSHNA